MSHLLLTKFKFPVYFLFCVYPSADSRPFTFPRSTPEASVAWPDDYLTPPPISCFEDASDIAPRRQMLWKYGAKGLSLVRTFPLVPDFPHPITLSDVWEDEMRNKRPQEPVPPIIPRDKIHDLDRSEEGPEMGDDESPKPPPPRKRGPTEHHDEQPMGMRAEEQG